MISKNAAGYKAQTTDAQRCAICTMFRPPNVCTLVKGEIAPQGWCKHYEHKARAAASPITKAIPMSDFQFFMPIAKVDKEARTVSGYASTPTKDGDGEIVTLNAVKGALPGYMEYGNIREMHALKAVGVAQEANIDTKGLFLTARIVDDAAWAKCVEGVYKGFSIGGKKLAKTGNKITEIEMTEISIVDRPSNPDARFALAKSQKNLGDAAGFLLKAKTLRTPEQKALAKMAKVVEGLAKAGNPPAAHDGLSLPAAVEKAVDSVDACKTHGTVDCEKCTAAKAAGKEPCEEHGVFDCDKCDKAAKAAKDELAKREFDEKKREEMADAGTALPDGSYPIANTNDLKNAIQAYGRAKDKGKAKAHIVARAKALSAESELPEGWSSGKKEAKAAKKAAKAHMAKALNITTSTTGDFLSLDKTAVVVDDDPFVLRKGMGVAGSLAYSFDSIREAQRRLLAEGKREGGDTKDKALAKELGKVAERLANVISLKATHEGAEALDLSDADDQYMTTLLGEDYMMDKVGKNGEIISTGDPIADAVAALMKRATTPSRAQRMEMAKADIDKSRKAAKAARKAVEDVHKMLKASYMAKAAKKDKSKDDDDGDEFDHAEAMGKLQKAYQEIDKARTFGKAAGGQITKAAARSGQRGQEVNDGNENYKVPAGITDLSPETMANLGPASKAAGIDFAKFAKDGMIPANVAELIMAKARSDGELEALRRMPANTGRRPMNFDMTKMAGGGDNGDTRALSETLFKGVDVSAIGSGDEQRHNEASARAIGNLLTSQNLAKSIMDPTFHGTAGIGKA